LIDFALAGDFDGWWAAFKQLILPACTMALFVIAPLARITRASMLASLGSDFVRTARSARPVVVADHRHLCAAQRASCPCITIAGIVFSTMLGANVLVEKVFSWPGVASYALDALLSSDYAPVQGFVLLMASVFVIVNGSSSMCSMASPIPGFPSDEQRNTSTRRVHPPRQPRHRHRRHRRIAANLCRRSSVRGSCPMIPSRQTFRTR
jgi:hypothetical protein